MATMNVVGGRESWKSAEEEKKAGSIQVLAGID